MCSCIFSCLSKIDILILFLLLNARYFLSVSSVLSQTYLKYEKNKVFSSVINNNVLH